MRTNIIFLLLLSISVSSFCQSKHDNIRIEDIIFKAKILTISHQGLLHKEDLVKHIEVQKHNFYYFTDSNYVIIKIDNKQPFITQYANSQMQKYCQEDTIDNCSFLIVYSYYSGFFYRIKGFAYSEFSYLYKEISAKGISIYDLLSKGDINIDCYINKYIKKRKGFKELCDAPCDIIECTPIELH